MKKEIRAVAYGDGHSASRYLGCLAALFLACPRRMENVSRGQEATFALAGGADV